MYRKLLLLSLVFVMGVAFLPMSSELVQAQDEDSDGEWEIVVYDDNRHQIATINQDGEQEKLADFELPDGAVALRLSPDRSKVAYYLSSTVTGTQSRIQIKWLNSANNTSFDCEDLYDNLPENCHVVMGAFSPDSEQFALGYVNNLGDGLVVVNLKGSFNVEYGLDTTSYEEIPSQVHWEGGTILVTPRWSYSTIADRGFDLAWTGNRELTTSNRYRIFQARDFTLNSGETIIPVQNFSYPFRPVIADYKLENVVTYFESASDFRTAYFNDELSTHGIPLYHNSSGIKFSKIVSNGNGILIETYDATEQWVYVDRQGNKIVINEVISAFGDIMPRYEPSDDDFEIVATPTGWVLYSPVTHELWEFEVHGSEIEITSLGGDRSLSILETPELVPANPIPFTAIEPYDWGEPICEGALPSRLEIGSNARVRTGFDIPVHFEPREDSLQVYQIGSFAHLLIFDGPECVNGHPWWKVSYTFAESGLLYGWVQEFDGNSYWLEPRGIRDSSLEVAQDFRESNTPSNYPSNTEYFCPGYLNNFVLRVGMQGQVLPGDFNNIRSEPFGDADLIGQIPGEGVFEVIDGPRCSSDVLWWKVDYNGTIGWTGEGIRNIYWVEPYSPEDDIPSETVTTCEGFLPSRLKVGGTGKVTPGAANNVRTEARYDAELVGQIPGGESFTMLDGPVCGENSAWWQVEYEGVTGWTAEGQGDDYWLEP